ncbi:MAG: transcription elongation factor GreA [bacterium]|nr:transcription elongation factor GreA [bacterium]MDT8394921.1 transcription elongation factor GreA [bacterium]
MIRYPITPEGLKKLQQELKKLKSKDRPKVIEAIAVARGHGDISENAEYDAAKEQQAFLEKRIRDIENKVANANVVDPSAMSTDRVVFGLQVTVQDLDSGEEVSYQIVGVDEADISAQRISVSSPVARALIGKRVGDVVQVQIPRGLRELEVLDISNP